MTSKIVIYVPNRLQTGQLIFVFQSRQSVVRHPFEQRRQSDIPISNIVLRRIGISRQGLTTVIVNKRTSSTLLLHAHWNLSRHHHVFRCIQSSRTLVRKRTKLVCILPNHRSNNQRCIFVGINLVRVAKRGIENRWSECLDLSYQKNKLPEART